MCLGIPMKIKIIKGDFAEVESGGLSRTINIQMLNQAQEGDYVIVHAGFAIQKLDPKKAKETLKLLTDPAILKDSVVRNYRIRKGRAG